MAEREVRPCRILRRSIRRISPTRNQYLSLCRERKHRGELEQEPGDDGLECGFADRDAAKRLHRLLHDLPEPYKEVFSLRTFGELPFAQIGELFGKTESWGRVT